MEVSQAEFHLHVLRSLLHYHERMMIGVISKNGKNVCADTADGKCPRMAFQDAYADALKEAIRCIEIVHGDELLGG